MKPPIAVVLLLAVITISTIPSYGQDHPKTQEEAQALVAKLKFQQGEVVLKDGLATLKVPEGVQFLNGRDAHTVLVTLWGNPPMPDPLGLLMPVNAGPLDPDSWAVIITYEEEGYVKTRTPRRSTTRICSSRCKKIPAKRTRSGRSRDIRVSS